MARSIRPLRLGRHDHRVAPDPARVIEVNANVLLDVAFIVLFLLTAGLGILMVRSARERILDARTLRRRGYGIAVVYGILGVALPVFWLFSLATNSSAPGSFVKECSHFPTQRAAQLYYDHTKDEEWSHAALLDSDGDGIACEGATFAETSYFTMRFGDVLYVFETTSTAP